MSPETKITFVRHGEVLNPARVYYGRLPRFSLSEAGRQQALAAAQVIRRWPVRHLFCSPLLRARQTARILLDVNPRLRLHFSRLLLEVHSPFDGHLSQALMTRGWDLYSGVERPYEQPDDVLARARRFMARVRRRFPGQHVAAITHGDLIAFSILWVCGQPITALARRQLPECGVPDGYPAPASLSTFTFRTPASDERPSVEYVKPY
jgi:broad specificity phosphatase PhoE